MFRRNAFYSFASARATRFIVMEFIDRKTLRACFLKKQALDDLGIR